MLAAMFSGRGFKMEKDEDGCYFIDRPGAPFAHILHYLQTGVFNPPSDNSQLKALQLEADFYQIQSLIDLLTVKSFRYTSLNDNNGIVNWLGTARGTTSVYANPVTSNIITVLGSPNPTTVVTMIAGNDGGWCTSAINKYFTVIFPIVICPTSYSLSHSTCCAPRHWTLDASMDGVVWTSLHTNITAGTIPTNGRGNFSLHNPNRENFTQFRITCTGCDAASTSTCYCFHVNGFELYGEVKVSAV